MRRINHFGSAITLCLTVLGWVWVTAAERTITRQKLGDLESRVGALAGRAESDADQLRQMQTTIVRIHTDVSWIRQELDRVRHPRSAE